LERDPVWCGEVFLQVGTAVSVLREKEREEGGGGGGEWREEENTAGGKRS